MIWKVKSQRKIILRDLNLMEMTATPAMVLVTTVQVIWAIMLRCSIMIVGQKQKTVGTLKKTILSPHLNKMVLK